MEHTYTVVQLSRKGEIQRVIGPFPSPDAAQDWIDTLLIDYPEWVPYSFSIKYFYSPGWWKAGRW